VVVTGARLPLLLLFCCDEFCVCGGWVGRAAGCCVGGRGGVAVGTRVGCCCTVGCDCWTVGRAAGWSSLPARFPFWSPPPPPSLRVAVGGTTTAAVVTVLGRAAELDVASPEPLWLAEPV
jgi:hypothetical protein